MHSQNVSVLWAGDNTLEAGNRGHLLHGKPELVRVELDRAAAIRDAIAGAGPGDIVLIAGKGHEDYQIIGDERLQFSDQDIVRKTLPGVKS